MQNDHVSNNIPILLSFLILISYFLGFHLDENSAGGGGYQGDLFSIWKNQQIFLENSLRDSIIHEDYFNSRPPLTYILHQYLNPFVNNIEDYRKVVLGISCILPILLFFSLQKNFKTQKTILLFLSLLVMLSPYFRTSSYWALEENYSLCFLVLTYISIVNFKNYLILKKEKNYINIFFVCFFSCLTFYFDQKLVIIPILTLCFLMFSSLTGKEKLFSLIVFLIFSLPYLYLITLWGTLIPTQAASRLLTFDYENIGYTLTIMAFYVFPFIFFKKKFFTNLRVIFLQKKNLIFIFLMIVYLVIFFLNFEQFYLTYLHGNGILYKVSVLFHNIFIKKIFLIIGISVSFLILINYFSLIHDRLIIFYFLILSLIITPVYQEYFDPLIFIMMLTFFKEKIEISFKLTIFLFIYFSSLLIGSNYYYIKVL